MQSCVVAGFGRGLADRPSLSACLDEPKPHAQPVESSGVWLRHTTCMQENDTPDALPSDQTSPTCDGVFPSSSSRSALVGFAPSWETGRGLLSLTPRARLLEGR